LATFYPQLGNLAEWIAAVGTVAAFMGGLYVINRDQESRREQRATASYDAALAVTIAVGPAGKTVPDPDGPPGEVVNKVITIPLAIVTNGSTRTIYDVKVDVRIPWGERLGSTLWDELPPRTHLTCECLQHDDMWSKAPGAYAMELVAIVTFEDAGRTRWFRDNANTIRRSD
jgi:hypothetical protein